MEELLLISILISFVIALLMTPKWIRKCRITHLLWQDMNKPEKKEQVAASGGIITVISFTLGVLSYIALRTFVLKQDLVATNIFSLLCVILILAIVGLTDDLLGWKHGGLSVKFRLFLAFIASTPLVVINAGTNIISIPFLGPVNLGLIYPLILIPIGIAGATTTYNFLAGFNGLEAGLGIITISYLSFISYVTGTSWLAVVGLCMVASLIAFYIYNKYPSKVFPGDTLTYSIGALIAAMAILGNFEKIAVFVFIPHIIETFLKLRGGLKKQSFGKVNKDKSLEMPYKKIYGLTHLSIFILKKFKKKVYEKDVVYLIFIFQIIIILLSILLFSKSIIFQNV